MKRRVIAITGGIGSGKSEVRKLVELAGYSALSCDDLAKEVAAFPDTLEKVANLLGDKIVINGELDRKAVREIVFQDGAKLSQYNAIFFEEVKKLLCARLETMSGVIFVEIPVFDAFEFDWDGVWLVDSDVSTRINRAAKRDSVSQENLQNIVSSQKICKSYTVKIDNSRGFEYLAQQVELLLKSLNE